MYAQLSIIKLGPGMRSPAEKLADQFAPLLKSLKGFQKVTFFGDEAVGEYGSLSIWASKEDAEAAAVIIEPELKKAVGGMLKAPPTRQFLEVYEPKA